jgi:hypothetical protein
VRHLGVRRRRLAPAQGVEARSRPQLHASGSLENRFRHHQVRDGVDQLLDLSERRLEALTVAAASRRQRRAPGQGRDLAPLMPPQQGKAIRHVARGARGGVRRSRHELSRHERRRRPDGSDQMV